MNIRDYKASKGVFAPLVFISLVQISRQVYKLALFSPLDLFRPYTKKTASATECVSTNNVKLLSLLIGQSSVRGEQVK